MKRLLLALLLVCAAAFPSYAQTNSDTITADEDAATFAVVGRGSIGVKVTGTFTATLQFEVTISEADSTSLDAATWTAVDALPPTGGAVTSASGEGIWTVITSGYTHFRVRASAWSSGTITVRSLTAATPGRPGLTGEITDLLGVTALGQTTEEFSIPVVQASDAAFTINPSTAGGLTPYFLLASTDTATTGKVVKASPGQVYGVQAFSLDATPVYIKFYNSATAPTCASDTIVKQLTIPANSTASLASGFLMTNLNGVAFSAGISFCATTGIAANDTGALTASEVSINIDSK